MEVRGTFDAQRFFETLAMIISRKENVVVKVKVIQQPKEQRSDKRKTA